MKVLPSILAVASATAVTAGAAMWSVPAGLVVGGLFGLACAYLLAYFGVVR